MARTKIELFGGPRVRAEDGTVTSLQAKPGALLALLCLKVRQRRTREELAESLWPDEFPDVTRARLRVALSSLKNAIPGGNDLIVADKQSIWISQTARHLIDVVEF